MNLALISLFILIVVVAIGFIKKVNLGFLALGVEVVALVGKHTVLIPILMFFLSAFISAIGSGHIAAGILMTTFAMYLAFERIVTSELKMDPLEVIDKYHGLTQIEDQFRVMKVDHLPGDLYRFMDVDDPDLKLILDAFDIKIPAKLYRRSEL